MEEKRVTTKDLLSQEHIYKTMIDEMEDYTIVLLDINGTVKSWNKGAQKIKGFDAEEIIGKNFRVFYLEEERKKRLPEQFIEEAKISGKAVSEGWRLKKDGSKIWVNSVLSTLRDSDNAIIGFTKIIRNYTDRKKQDEQSQFLSNIVRNIQDPVISTDINLLITDWNPAATDFFGWTKEEVLGKPTAEVLKASYPDKDIEEIRNSYKAKGFWKGEGIFHTKSGEPRNMLVTASHMKEKDGTVIGSIVLAKDITKRKKAEMNWRD